MTAALWEHIGKIFHAYIDDVVVWSDNLEDHQWHIDMVLQDSQCAHLYMTLKKCHFFLTEVDFLGHHIST